MTSSEIIKLPAGTKIPNHIALIPDGNRRWARARGLNTLEGHKAGFDRAVELARAARAMGVHTVTLWGFSTENWDRARREINYLMRLYARLIDIYIKDAHKEKIRLVHLGRKDRIPGFLLKKIEWAESETMHYKKHIGNIAIDYGGQDDILRAVRAIVQDEVQVQDINADLFSKYLDTRDQPYPYVDLVIRTSGEQRVSGFLMWQMNYAEMYWVDAHFPGFSNSLFREAILDYSRRRRRFGGNDKEEHFKFKPRLAAKLEIEWWRLQNIPEGTRFRDYALSHLREQWGISKGLAARAATLMVQASVERNENKWKQATESLKEFYKLLRDEVKLAFEPSIAASLQVKLWKDMRAPMNGEVEETMRTQLAEVYRLSDFQAKKAAHLRALAANEAQGERWDKASDYLLLYYEALKDKVA